MAKEAYSMEHNSTLYHLFFPSSKVHTYKLIDRALKTIINSRNKVQGSHAHKKEKKIILKLCWASFTLYIYRNILLFYNLILFHTAVAFYFQDWIIKNKSEYMAKNIQKGMAILLCCQTIKHFKNFVFVQIADFFALSTSCYWSWNVW